MSFIKKYITDSHFSYENINQFNQNKLNKYIQKTHNRFKKESSLWSYKKNEFWVLRLYASTKMILSSTVLYSCYEFSDENKIYLSLPYFEYYGLINSCRSLMLLNSNQDDFTKIFTATHSQIIIQTTQSLKSIDDKLANEFNKHINYLKDYREKFTYNFPTKKILVDEFKTIEESINYSKIITELSQLNSEILEYSVDSVPNKDYFQFGYDDEYNAEFFNYFNTDEDFHRARYITRKIKRPINILLFTTEGLSEDFLGNYIEEYTEEHGLGALHNLQLIFPFN